MMRRQSVWTGLGLSLAFALLTWQSAAAEETLYETGKYLEGCCETPACDAPCGGCGDACCLNCCSTCSGWYAGAEAFWAQPRIKDNNAFSLITSDFSMQPFTFTTVTVPFDYDYDVTPRIWLGYMDCCGAGFRGSWWKYDDDSNPVEFLDPNSLGAFTAAQRLELELADIELTNAFDLCGGCALVSYGVRYVRYRSATHEQINDINGALLGRIQNADTFDGVGPTLALEFNRPVNCRWSVYGKLRGTIAMGERDTSSTTAVLGQSNLFSRSGQEAMAIGELQIGVQWNYCCWFVRGGWQAQYWDDSIEVGGNGVAQPMPEAGTLGAIAVHGFNIAVGYGR